MPFKYMHLVTYENMSNTFLTKSIQSFDTFGKMGFLVHILRHAHIHSHHIDYISSTVVRVIRS